MATICSDEAWRLRPSGGILDGPWPWDPGIQPLAMSATTPTSNKIIFDTDSIPLCIDNCATKCLSPYIDDFETAPISTNQTIKGIGGAMNDVMIGTISWSIEDDEGRPHRIRIPNSIYLKGATTRLLSPQHWAQEAKDNKPQEDGTWCATYRDRIELYWNPPDQGCNTHNRHDFYDFPFDPTKIKHPQCHRI